LRRPTNFLHNSTKWSLKSTKNEPSNILEQVSDFGTQAHELIESLFKGDKPDIPENLSILAKNFQQWHRSSGLTYVQTEKPVISKKFQYGGTLDAIAKRNGNKLVCIDWKTSNYFQTEYALQLAAYVKALEEMEGSTVSEAWVIRLSKDKDGVEARHIQDINASFRAFIAALTLWKSLQKTHI